MVSKICWEITKVDVMSSINKFNNLQVGHFQWLNSANIVLLPKKGGEGAKILVTKDLLV
jgi:hypothetical protein